MVTLVGRMWSYNIALVNLHIYSNSKSTILKTSTGCLPTHESTVINVNFHNV